MPPHEFAVGRFYIVRYNIGGAEFWHERLITGVTLDGENCAVVTPDMDHYLEPCTDESDNIHIITNRHSDSY